MLLQDGPGISEGAVEEVGSATRRSRWRRTVASARKQAPRGRPESDGICASLGRDRRVDCERGALGAARAAGTISPVVLCGVMRCDVMVCDVISCDVV